MQTVTERFLRYVGLDTQSDDRSASFPSTEGQLALGRMLVEELREMGAEEAQMDENGYVTATLPSNLGPAAPTLGLIAHMDTAADFSGAGVKARIVKSYDGGAVLLNEQNGMELRPEEFDSLRACVGEDLIVTDGTTLLGGDDKAGVAEIMAAADRLLHDPSLPHGRIRIAFTPDEEIGCGTDRFNVKDFGADFAYTVDGGGLGELEYENFNAATARLVFRGVSIHPGSAKNKMINAIRMGMEFDAMLPRFEDPAATEGYEGFHHLHRFEGTADCAELEYLIRDHDRGRFEEKKARFEKAAAYLGERYGEEKVSCTIEDSYYNMKEQILPHIHLIETAETAMRSLGIEPVVMPIRGGTDGARLSYQGLPCPNLFTGTHNGHGPYEFVSIQAMEKAVELLVRIAALTAENAPKK
ncbi:MAG: peptidase T [Provencibacterium sp.]|jgi:tripeptide aminopeptidase|nr:peptidase T [Provencibacterium sp.]